MAWLLPEFWSCCARGGNERVRAKFGYYPDELEVILADITSRPLANNLGPPGFEVGRRELGYALYYCRHHPNWDQLADHFPAEVVKQRHTLIKQTTRTTLKMLFVHFKMFPTILHSLRYLPHNHTPRFPFSVSSIVDCDTRLWQRYALRELSWEPWETALGDGAYTSCPHALGPFPGDHPAGSSKSLWGAVLQHDRARVEHMFGATFLGRFAVFIDRWRGTDLTFLEQVIYTLMSVENICLRRGVQYEAYPSLFHRGWSHAPGSSMV
eukprot:TRINITY_DN14278_c0_g1_i2.p1 TRINITY_DN14278_c0_g1~~TRINITY_DN14278_c0_g1_i2.p1  ORF type:complete len:267 (+),score=7.11 TRINITY_DN14278_c0_g1_i2:61-861(+)